MGQSKGGGYTQLPTMTGSQQQLQGQYENAAMPWQNQAAQGYQQFLPGGGGGQPIIDAAMNRYKQQTIPSIMNAFGSNAKSSSALNQALGASASDLNTNLAAQLSQMQLQAAQGLGNMGQNAGNQALNNPNFAYQPTQLPFWQQAILQMVGNTGKLPGIAAGAMTGGM